WRGIFLAFVMFAAIVSLWFALRQGETLPPPARRPFRLRGFIADATTVLRHPVVSITIMVQTLSFAALFTILSTTQPVFDQVYGRAVEFPYYFAGMALVAGTANIVNARLVVRVGMRRMVTVSFAVQAACSLLALAGLAMLPAGTGAAFAVYLVWTTSVFYMAGLTIGNLNALSLEPMGHIAGTAASVVMAVATVLS